MDRHRVDADPDSNFYVDANPDLDPDLDPDWYQMNTDLHADLPQVSQNFFFFLLLVTALTLYDVLSLSSLSNDVTSVFIYISILVY